MTKAGTWTTIALLFVAGCAGGAPKAVRSIARSDLTCDQVNVEEIADNRYGAYGCGRGAVYAKVCDQTGCRWGRLRHGHEAQVAIASQPPSAAPATREVVAAPPPSGREVQVAPPPAAREVIPAPPPGSTSGGEQPAVPPPAQGTQGTDTQGAAAPADQQAQPTGDTGTTAPAPVPLSQGDLSAPYDSQVPAQPAGQRIDQPPPAPLVEDRPPPPSTTYVWVSGYWWWGGPNWLWVPGYWAPPRPGFVYMTGSWYWSTGWWWYWPGGWCYPGTYYVAYPPPPRPHTVVPVRSFTPHRVVMGGSTVAHGPVRVTPGAPGATASRVPAPVRTQPFAPRPSPLLRYPSSPQTILRSPAVAQAPRALGSSGVGHVVRPSDVVRPYQGGGPSALGRSSAYRAPSSSIMRAPSSSYRGYQPPPRVYSAPRTYSPRSYSPPRMYTAPRMPPPSAPRSMPTYHAPPASIMHAAPRR